MAAAAGCSVVKPSQSSVPDGWEEAFFARNYIFSTCDQYMWAHEIHIPFKKHDSSAIICYKKIMIMLLTLLFTCLAFFRLGEFGLAVHGPCFHLRMLV
jgi:hypothetical protein